MAIDHAQRRPIDPVEARRLELSVAANLGCAVPTVRKILRGEPVRGSVGDRIRRALVDRGVELPESAS